MAGNPETRKASFKIFILCLSIILLGIISISTRAYSSPVSLHLFPQVPREGEPFVASLILKNFELKDSIYEYEFYRGEENLASGRVTLSPFSSKTIRYSYINSLKLGEQVTFLAKVRTPRGNYREAVSFPAYPPQVWTSFVSFAAFSTSMAGLSSSMSVTSMTSMTTIAYYRGYFGPGQAALNVGVIFAVVLIGILLHVEVTAPFKGNLDFLGRLRNRFSRLAVILFVIFAAMVFTEVILIIN